MSSFNDLDKRIIYTTKEMKMHVHEFKVLNDTSNLTQEGETGKFEHFDGAISSNPLTKDDVNNFISSGYFISEDVVHFPLIQGARNYINANYPSWIKQSRRQDDWRIHFMLEFDDMESKYIEHRAILDLLLLSPKLLGYVRALLNDEPGGIFYNQIAYRTPLEEITQSVMEYTPGADYHIDGQANSSGTRFPDPWTILVGIALVDIEGVDMGNFTVFPGSHICRDWSNYPNEKKSKSLPDLGPPHKVQLKAGSAVFCHVLLAHRGGKNTTSKSEAMSSKISYEGLQNIPIGTREMIFFRIRAKSRDYFHPDRSANVLNDPCHEYKHLLSLI